MPQLDFQWFLPQLFWLGVTFITLYLVMSRAALPKINQAITARKEKIAGDFRKAESNKEEAERLEKEYAKLLLEAQGQGSKIVTEATKDAAGRVSRETSALEASLALKLSEAEKKIADKRGDAIKAILPYQVEICQMIVEKLANVKVSQEKANVVVNNLMKGNK